MFFGASILEGFWEGFGRPKSSIFALFSQFFRCKILNATWKGKKSTQEVQQDADDGFLPLDSGGPPPAGERKREGLQDLC